MGLSRGLVIGPLVIMAMLTLIGATTYVSSNVANPFCQSPSNYLQCSQIQGTTTNGTIQGGGTTYTCTPSDNACTLPFSCPNPVPSPTYCSAAGLWILPGGNSIFITSSAQANLGPAPVSQNNNLSFGPIGPDGFIVMISTASAIIVIAAINFFSTGVNTEGVHIAFEVGLLLGLWIILSALEGFLGGRGIDPFFYPLDAFITNLGSTMYGTLTLFYTLGTIGTVARSPGGGV